MKKYSELTREQKEAICNGCGGKGGFVKPPHKAFFKASCNHHDFGYWKGVTEADKIKCDNLFFKAMREDCRKLSWYNYIRYRPWCWLYYKAVKTIGKKFFYYGDKQRDPDIDL